VKQEILCFPAGGDEVQRLQRVELEGWNLQFLQPGYSTENFGRVCDLYEKYLIPACPWVFGQLVLFRLPEGETPVYTGRRYGTLAGAERNAAAILREGVSLRGGRPVFRTAAVRALWKRIEEKGELRIIRGKLPNTQLIPVGRLPGLLSECEKGASLKVNASFFIMDPFDCATVYDVLGTPFGCCIKDGVCLQPPLFGREMLAVGKNGSVRIEQPALTGLSVQLGGSVYRHGKNARFYERPHYTRTPHRGTDYVIIGREVVAVKEGGGTAVPAGGFVLHTPGKAEHSAGTEVSYGGTEQIAFGIQAGNSVIKDGKPTAGFTSKFFNIRRPLSLPYPPSLYPMDFEKARAPRIVLGADRAGKPVLVWVEGAGKFGHVAGEEGCGASLKELGTLCSQLGLHQAVNLDGGGSAQLLLEGKRALRLSDRDAETFAQRERAVPLGLMLK